MRNINKNFLKITENHDFEKIRQDYWDSIFFTKHFIFIIFQSRNSRTIRERHIIQSVYY